MVLVDSSVLLDIFTEDATWRLWSVTALRDARATGLAGINPLIYAETSLAFDSVSELDRELDALLLERLQLPFEAGFGAGRTFLEYRRAGGARSSPMPDFYIGAHAALEGLTLLTRDTRRYRAYFPSVALISPQVHHATHP
ncbi:MAG: type II toxin-antitoxin system VapC family toxin [Acidobacteriia bacterium]|nr:type II toxin-antitoxin system VapC family toxin [Terriglobia bacterium]MYG03770.1 type II toxin-antitoxin system VapC family toxin [Terriglobia bacterium]MYK09820.1 type II toxin-antitoxin system VapC family toxin [Terriglobia bacterium]